jgi:c-di-GMP-binding flagellar brake protein YcgR
MEESIVKITNEGRIARILDRVIGANMQVYLRWPKDPSVAVKGKLSPLAPETGQADLKGVGIKISDISEKGVRYLVSKDVIQVEFVLMSTKIIFASRVIFRDKEMLVVAIPKCLVSIERRKNARFKATPGLLGSIRLEQHKPSKDDFTAMPYFSCFASLAGALKVEDVSLGGLSVSTQFPSIIPFATRGTKDEGAILTLPLQKPVLCPLEVRWVKRITSHENDGDEKTVKSMSIKLGFQFTSVSSELENAIRVYIMQVSQAEAI